MGQNAGAGGRSLERMYQRPIASPAQADEAGYKISIKLMEGETLDVGGYRIFRRDGRIQHPGALSGGQRPRAAIDTEKTIVDGLNRKTVTGACPLKQEEQAPDLYGRFSKRDRFPEK